jgi:glycosyltransferase involved in cell wall biosynthesis
MHLGSQVYVGGMCAALAARGHEVSLVCYAHGNGLNPPSGVRLIRAAGVPWGAIDRSGPHWSKLAQDVGLARRVRAQRHSVDIVHAHNVESPVVARLGLGRTRIPLIYNQHARMEQELPSYLPWMSGASSAGRALDGIAAASATACVAISQRGMDHLLGQHRDVTLIPPGIHPEDVRQGDAARARQRWALGAGRWVLYAGNLDAYQDLPILYEAMRRVDDLGLLVVTGDSGDVPTGLPSERVRVIRSRDFLDTVDAIAVADFAVIPRRYCAGFPIKLLNFLAAGLVTVVSNGASAGIPGEVPVGDGDPDAIAEALRSLSQDQQRCSSLSKAATEAIRRHWSWDVRAAQLEAMYARLALM